MTSKIEISYKTIIFIAVFIALIWLVVEIQDILFLLFISFILMSALRPQVEFFEKYRIPRAISIIGVYILVISIVAFAVGSLIPPLVTQTSKLIANLPRYISLIAPYANIDIRSITAQIAPISENIVRVTVGLFSNIIATLTVGVFTFYLLLERGRLVQYMQSIGLRSQVDNIISLVEDIETSLGSWLRGQFVLMVIIGVFTYLGLIFLKVDYALPLAIFAGILEIIPVIGPIVSGVPAVFVAMSTSPILGLSTVALYFIVQQLENHLIVPIVMNKAVGLSPLIIIISLMIGSRLSGIFGAVLSIPIVIMLRVIIKHFLYKDS